MCMCKLTHFILLFTVKCICPDRSAQVHKSRIFSSVHWQMASLLNTDLLNRKSLMQVRKTLQNKLTRNWEKLFRNSRRTATPISGLAIQCPIFTFSSHWACWTQLTVFASKPCCLFILISAHRLCCHGYFELVCRCSWWYPNMLGT